MQYQEGLNGIGRNNREDNPSWCREVLERISNSWEARSCVRRNTFPSKLMFEDDKPDFLIELIPFRHHPLFIKADEAMKSKILTCGWLAYNEKTLAIENDIISPACRSILDGKVPGATDEVSIRLVSETLVDEAYHVLMTVHACRLTRTYRQMAPLSFPEFNLVRGMKMLQQQCEHEWQKIIVQLSTAIVSEVFISDYLGLLSHSNEIQLINKLTVEAHRRDELVHSRIFKIITPFIYNAMNNEQKNFFASVLPQPIHWFANNELVVWESMLNQIGFKDSHILINDCRADLDENLNSIDYSGVVSIAEELGIYDFKERVGQ